MAEIFKIAIREIAGKDHYQVYELVDPSLPDTEENRKNIGGAYEARWCAERLAGILNKEGERI